MRRRAALPLAALLAAALGWAGQEPAPAPAAALADAARAILASLTPEQAARLQFPADSTALLDWHYVPRERPGLPLAALDASQRAAVELLLRAALGAQGWGSVDAVRRLDDVLRGLEERGGGSAPHRDALLYDLAIFGDPSPSAPWAFRFEGHHVSVTVSTDGEGRLGFTPFFLGANPRRVPDGGPRAGEEPLGARERTARAFFLSLAPAPRAQAHLAATPPRELLLTPGTPLRALEPAGLRCDALADAERQALLELLGCILGDIHPELGGRELLDLAREQLSATSFAWFGSAERGALHAFRIQSPRLLYEWTTAQGDANHVHACLRDLERDASLGWGRAGQAETAAEESAAGR